MFKKSKICMSVFLALILLASYPIIAFAETVDEDNIEYIQPGKLTGFTSIPEEGVEVGEYQSFKSVDNDINPTNVPYRVYKSGDLIYSNDVVINTGLVQKDRAYFNSKSNLSKIFVRYLTSSWAKASSYSWSKSNTVKWEVAGNVEVGISQNVVAKLGLSTSRTTTYNTTITMPAISTKYSKLGFASDFTKLSYTHKRYTNDKLLFSKTETVKTPAKDTYLMVVYK